MALTAAVPHALPAAELRRDGTAVRVAAARGAPITSFVAGGRDWCDDGAWHDYAPTRAECTLPTYVSGAGAASIPAGGLLALDEAGIQVRADGSLGAISAQWPPSSYPLDWMRTVAFDADGSLLAEYQVHSAHDEPLPFVWGLPIPLPWERSVRVELPRGARARVASSWGEGLPSAGSEFTWPSLRHGGRLVDLGHPTRLASRSAVVCFVELPQGQLSVRAGGVTLEVSSDPNVLTHARVEINNDADLPGSPPRRWWRRRVVKKTVAIGPAAGAPDTLSDAVGAWRAAQWIEPGATLVWTVRYRVNT